MMFLYKIKKLILSISLLVVLVIAIAFTDKSTSVNAAVIGNSAEELGYAINVVKSYNYLNYNLGAPVLKEDFLRNLTVNINSNITQKERTYFS